MVDPHDPFAELNAAHNALRDATIVFKDAETVYKAALRKVASMPRSIVRRTIMVRTENLGDVAKFVESME